MTNDFYDARFEQGDDDPMKDFAAMVREAREQPSILELRDRALEAFEQYKNPTSPPLEFDPPTFDYDEDSPVERHVHDFSCSFGNPQCDVYGKGAPKPGRHKRKRKFSELLLWPYTAPTEAVRTWRHNRCQRKMDEQRIDAMMLKCAEEDVRRTQAMCRKPPVGFNPPPQSMAAQTGIGYVDADTPWTGLVEVPQTPPWLDKQLQFSSKEAAEGETGVQPFVPLDEILTYPDVSEPKPGSPNFFRRKMGLPTLVMWICSTQECRQKVFSSVMEEGSAHPEGRSKEGCPKCDVRSHIRALTWIRDHPGSPPKSEDRPYDVRPPFVPMVDHGWRTADGNPHPFGSIAWTEWESRMRGFKRTGLDDLQDHQPDQI